MFVKNVFIIRSTRDSWEYRCQLWRSIPFWWSLGNFLVHNKVHCTITCNHWSHFIVLHQLVIYLFDFFEQSGCKFVVKTKILGTTGGRIYFEQYIFKLPNEEVNFVDLKDIVCWFNLFVFWFGLMYNKSAYFGGKRNGCVAW